jgi:hypothetical protein
MVENYYISKSTLLPIKLGGCHVQFIGASSYLALTLTVHNMGESTDKIIRVLIKYFSCTILMLFYL